MFNLYYLHSTMLLINNHTIKAFNIKLPVITIDTPIINHLCSTFLNTVLIQSS